MSAGSSRRLFIAALILVEATIAFAAESLVDVDEHAIFTRALENLYPKQSLQVLALDSYTTDGRHISRREVQIASTVDNGKGQALLRIIEPADLRGVSVLLDSTHSGNHELFVYLPVVGRSKRISRTGEKESFFGTALSFFDLIPKNPARFTARWSRKGSPSSCRWMFVVPNAQKREGYEKIEICIDKGSGAGREYRFFSEGVPTKIATVAVDSIRVTDGREVAFDFSVRSKTSGVITRVSVLSIEAAAHFPEQLFSLANLERGSATTDRAMIHATK